MFNPSVRAVEWGKCLMWWPSLMVGSCQIPLKEKNCYNLFFVFFREDNFHWNLNFTVSLSAKALS